MALASIVLTNQQALNQMLIIRKAHLHYLATPDGAPFTPDCCLICLAMLPFNTTFNLRFQRLKADQAFSIINTNSTTFTRIALVSGYSTYYFEDDGNLSDWLSNGVTQRNIKTLRVKSTKHGIKFEQVEADLGREQEKQITIFGQDGVAHISRKDVYEIVRCYYSSITPETFNNLIRAHAWKHIRDLCADPQECINANHALCSHSATYSRVVGSGFPQVALEVNGITPVMNHALYSIAVRPIPAKSISSHLKSKGSTAALRQRGVQSHKRPGRMNGGS